ncbi:carboxypeptidase-like regulatory domain-containing protein [Hymenobacter weizhouensis]|uniref:carboxypeptidase-like regulatory domain-containing protein n=1 Tax=Hymenobacter sp. YIM 151500-1 TaxID=2987689 RepID=UPI0022277AAD|nr:carboxypeptidase-like regulatory domain-containing protein [Hymenobacter sp. YIM 151500-1]UYZ62149.1 carboxypeptidase-like regulatory domain-containing protein [Hymenobacter sp. YIM 151500-1]
MPHRPTVTIPQPCHESWAAMTPAAQGRHCAACNKVVTDFTRMTDAEVVAWLAQQSGSSCGRFRQDQLHRPLHTAAPEATLWRTWLAAASAVLGFGAVAAPAAQAQQKERVETHVTVGMVATPKPPQPLLLPPPVVRGVVLDSATREPLPGVTVLVKGTTIGVYTNADGSFELVLPEEYRDNSSVELTFSSIGYVNQFHRAIRNESLTIVLAPDHRELGGLMVVAGGYYVSPWYTPRGLWQRLMRPFRRW